jgi:hypothetical protein
LSNGCTVHQIEFLMRFSDQIGISFFLQVLFRIADPSKPAMSGSAKYIVFPRSTMLWCFSYQSCAYLTEIITRLLISNFNIPNKRISLGYHSLTSFSKIFFEESNPICSLGF